MEEKTFLKEAQDSGLLKFNSEFMEIKILNKILIFVAFGLFIANIVLYVKSLELANNIKTMEKEIEALKVDTEKLRVQVFKEESIYNIASQASLLGFENFGKVIKIGDVKVALKE